MSPRVVVLEEHFSHPELLGGMPLKPLGERLMDLGQGRIAAMDEAGIDLQVLSHFPSGPQNLPADRAIEMARRTNDLIAETVARRPDRFAGFAALPLTAPDAACAELERAMRDLGLKGAMLHGMAAGVPLDDRRFWPVFQTAEALDAPIYIHPDFPPPAVAEAYYQDYPALIGPGWSYTVESATQALRLMICGVLDTCPGLKLILGHLGESLPFSIVRCDSILTPRANLKRRLIDYFHDHFWITTAANWSYPALTCTLMEMGPERVLFSVDWPFASNTEGRAFIDNAPLDEAVRTGILGANAVELLKL